MDAIWHGSILICTRVSDGSLGRRYDHIFVHGSLPYLRAFAHDGQRVHALAITVVIEDSLLFQLLVVSGLWGAVVFVNFWGAVIVIVVVRVVIRFNARGEDGSITLDGTFNFHSHPGS